MRPLSSQTRQLFKEWGKQGGEARSKKLSPDKRGAIAVKAARARWQKTVSASSMPSVRLNNPALEDPVYLEEILVDGGLAEWRQIYLRIADHPFGETAQALERVVGSVSIYGASRLWKSLLNHLRGGADE